MKTLNGDNDEVNSFAFPAEGRTLFSVSRGRISRQWDVASGKCISMPPHLAKRATESLSVTISHDGRTVVVGTADKEVLVLVSGRPRPSLRGHEDFVFSVTFSPDGTLLASGSRDNTIRLWGTRTWECAAHFLDHNGSVLAVAFSPDGRTLASGSDDDTIKLWSIGSGECFETLRGHAKEYCCPGRVADEEDGVSRGVT
ncbi:Protein kinase domain [Carpediemonas membranifera]|uniref:Protein kinase domain n=1 Tax=Carpediemonas membranifera TaxID=201153 RepID=A0A8J6DYS9_9EUKA|nr:Protein kinase domain [Carpediemonas membranifera]|eukprot:KAG9389516.1 Protein kinase domain [Carpediemonas membranifera]